MLNGCMIFVLLLFILFLQKSLCNVKNIDKLLNTLSGNHLIRGKRMIIPSHSQTHTQFSKNHQPRVFSNQEYTLDELFPDHITASYSQFPVEPSPNHAFSNQELTSDELFLTICNWILH
uniref:Uncharacterized protein n=1 Tax=Ditylenchus dipsaci TaxID=166011 RepID=A0A915EV78_9BILA